MFYYYTPKKNKENISTVVEIIYKNLKLLYQYSIP